MVQADLPLSLPTLSEYRERTQRIERAAAQRAEDFAALQLQKETGKRTAIV